MACSALYDAASDASGYPSGLLIRSVSCRRHSSQTQFLLAAAYFAGGTLLLLLLCNKLLEDRSVHAILLDNTAELRRLFSQAKRLHCSGHRERIIASLSNA